MAASGGRFRIKITFDLKSRGMLMVIGDVVADLVRVKDLHGQAAARPEIPRPGEISKSMQGWNENKALAQIGPGSRDSKAILGFRGRRKLKARL